MRIWTWGNNTYKKPHFHCPFLLHYKQKNPSYLERKFFFMNLFILFIKLLIKKNNNLQDASVSSVFSSLIKTNESQIPKQKIKCLYKHRFYFRFTNLSLPVGVILILFLSHLLFWNVIINKGRLQTWGWFLISMKLFFFLVILGWKRFDMCPRVLANVL